jgi:hypothetical protein
VLLAAHVFVAASRCRHLSPRAGQRITDASTTAAHIEQAPAQLAPAVKGNQFNLPSASVKQVSGDDVANLDPGGLTLTKELVFGRVGFFTIRQPFMVFMPPGAVFPDANIERLCRITCEKHVDITVVFWEIHFGLLSGHNGFQPPLSSRPS